MPVRYALGERAEIMALKSVTPDLIIGHVNDLQGDAGIA